MTSGGIYRRRHWAVRGLAATRRSEGHDDRRLRPRVLRHHRLAAGSLARPPAGHPPGHRSVSREPALLLLRRRHASVCAAGVRDDLHGARRHSGSGPPGVEVHERDDAPRRQASRDQGGAARGVGRHDGGHRTGTGRRSRRSDSRRSTTPSAPTKASSTACCGTGSTTRSITAGRATSTCARWASSRRRSTTGARLPPFASASGE